MNYQIIQDRAALDSFIASLPELGPNEKYYFSLFCRKKYWPHIKSDRAQLKRFLATKERIVEKIRQLECEVGSYSSDGIGIGNEGLALYMMPNPRCLVKATRQSLVKFAEFIANNNTGYNPYQEVLSQVQKSRSRGIYIDFDFDTDELPDLSAVLNPDSYRVLKTRGGFHVLTEVDKITPEFKKDFYMKMDALGADCSGDQLLPVPGCNQGGHLVHFL